MGLSQLQVGVHASACGFDGYVKSLAIKEIFAKTSTEQDCQHKLFL